VLKTVFYFIRSATIGFTVSAFLYPSRVSLKEAFAAIELCAGNLHAQFLEGRAPAMGPGYSVVTVLALSVARRVHVRVRSNRLRNSLWE
jgi:hypothetical protein